MTLRPTALVLAFAATVLSGGCTDSGPAGPTTPASDLGYDPTQALVRLAPGVPIATIHGRYGTRTIEAIEDARVHLLGLPSGTVVDEVLPAMRSDPDLQAASPNSETSVPEAQGRSTMAFADPSLHRADYTDQGAVRRIRAPEAWSRSRGGGVIVAVLDTGVDARHPDLSQRIAAGGRDFVDDDFDPTEARDGVDSDRDGLADEAYGHGTFIAGLVLSVSPDARILAVRVLDSDGIGTAMDVARGIEVAIDRGARVVNMSFGMAVPSDVVADMIAEGSRGGVVFVASAGNANSSRPQHPASEQEVLAVAAVDSADAKAEFSNHGPWVPVAAPGVGLVGPIPPQGYGRWSGTSFAAAMTSGEAAVLVAYRLAASGEVRAAIDRSAVDVGDPRLQGAGRIDVRAALDALGAPADEPGPGEPGDGPPGPGEPGDGEPGPADPGPDPGDGISVLTGLVASVDLLGRTIVLEGGARILVPTDDLITDGDRISLASVAVAVAAGDGVEATARVVAEGAGFRALEISFRLVAGGGGGGDSFVTGRIASVDLLARLVLLASGERILVPSDGSIAPDSEFATLAAVAAALALDASIDARATVVPEGDALRVIEISFHTGG